MGEKILLIKNICIAWFNIADWPGRDIKTWEQGPWFQDIWLFLKNLKGVQRQHNKSWQHMWNAIYEKPYIINSKQAFVPIVEEQTFNILP